MPSILSAHLAAFAACDAITTQQAEALEACARVGYDGAPDEIASVLEPLMAEAPPKMPLRIKLLPLVASGSLTYEQSQLIAKLVHEAYEANALHESDMEVLDPLMPE